MEVRIRGQMTIADIRQTLFEQLHELETKYAVQYTCGATLYINPTNAFGDDVAPRPTWVIAPARKPVVSYTDFRKFLDTSVSCLRPRFDSRQQL